jgi:hypothetical protein
MYGILLMLHSAMRWLALFSLIYAVYRAYRGWHTKSVFTKADDRTRHITATIVHIQLMLGLALYFISPVIDYFWSEMGEAVKIREIRFFGLEHFLLMLVAIICISVGSVIAKRQPTDAQKFKKIYVWYLVALILIVIAIPWPFSPLSAQRPYFRGF